MKVVPKEGCDEYDKRYVIVDDNGKIVDDAQGWGYKTRQKAHKAMWYKFDGGREKVKVAVDKKNAFFKEHKGLEKFLNKLYEYNFKEIARGEFTDDDIISEIKSEFGIDIPREFLSGPDYKKY